MEPKISRVNVVGTSGSGKSTFSRKLANVLDIPYLEMDQIFWGPNWYWPPDHEFFENLRISLKSESWVLDGNYTRTNPIKWEKVEMVVWLDYSLWTTLRQAISRALKRSFTKEELWPGTGNRESFRKSFLSKESIILWSLKTHGNVRRKMESTMKNPIYSHIKFIRLKSHSEAQQFLNGFKK